MTKKDPNATEEYILKPGNVHHGFKDGARHTYVGGEEGNDRVELKPHQAAAFSDKFESVAEQKDRLKAQNEIRDLQARQQKIQEALDAKGISLDDLLNEKTTKKPDPTPSTGTAEPAPDGTTPAPIGSTSDPVNAKPAAGSTGTSAAAASAKK